MYRGRKLLILGRFVEVFCEVEHRWRYLKRKRLASVCVPPLQAFAPHFFVALKNLPLVFVASGDRSLFCLIATFPANEAPIQNYVHVTTKQLLDNLPRLFLTPVNALCEPCKVAWT